MKHCDSRGEAVFNQQLILNMRLLERKIPGPKSEAIIKNAKRYEPQSMADQVPVVWDHGEGVWITDVDGNVFLDFT